MSRKRKGYGGPDSDVDKRMVEASMMALDLLWEAIPYALAQETGELWAPYCFVRSMLEELSDRVPERPLPAPRRVPQPFPRRKRTSGIRGDQQGPTGIGREGDKSRWLM